MWINSIAATFSAGGLDCDTKRESRAQAIAEKKKLTSLELIALGIVWKRGECSAYEVMSEFSGSLTAQFQSGAGSIYPMIKRLHREKLLIEKASQRGQQNKKLYKISSAGKKALTEWLTPPYSGEKIGLIADPVRSRVYFLGILPKDQQAEFIDNAINQLKAELRRVIACSKEYEDSDNEYGVLAMKGAIYVTRARIRWLSEIRKAI